MCLHSKTVTLKLGYDLIVVALRVCSSMCPRVTWWYLVVHSFGLSLSLCMHCQLSGSSMLAFRFTTSPWSLRSYKKRALEHIWIWNYSLLFILCNSIVVFAMFSVPVLFDIEYVLHLRNHVNWDMS